MWKFQIIVEIVSKVKFAYQLNIFFSNVDATFLGWMVELKQAFLT